MSIEEKSKNLREIRNRLLSLHKVLMDRDRENYERESGAVTPNKFLELLLSDERFEWLRTLSTLIVRIDEAFALDDGISAEMIEGFNVELRSLFDDSDPGFEDFKRNMNAALPELPEGQRLVSEIRELLDE